MTAPATVEVTKPGVYPDMPADTYHADPVPEGSLSSGGARRLLPPSCPAKFKWWLDHGQDASRVCEFGNAAHLEVLGIGTPVAVIDVDDWRTKAARAQLAAAREEGLTPVKVEEYERIQAMAAALRADPAAAAFFEPGSGAAEQSVFWIDSEFEVWRRSRLDWIPSWYYPDGRLVIPEYKTAAKADPVTLQRVVVDRGYDQQAAWETDAAIAAGLAPQGVAFVFVFQEKDPPFVVSVLQADVVVLERGRARNRWAMSEFKRGRETGRWPGYVEGVGSVELPRWVEAEFHDEVEHGRYQGLPGSRAEAGA
jgi:hypothetical protein